VLSAEGSRRPLVVVVVLAIVVVALFLRVNDLGRNPPEFFEDEIAAATSAWSIATTGHDVERTTLPFVRTRLVIQQPIYPFTVVPFWALLGKTPFAERLPAALYGLATVLLIIWLMQVLGLPWPVSAFAGAVAAVLPWSVQLSRIGWEPASVLPFALLGLGWLWTGLRDGRRSFVVGSAAVLAVASYTYLPSLMMNGLLALLILGIHRDKLREVATRVSLAISGAVAVPILIPFALGFRDPLMTNRPRNISVFAHGVNLHAFHKIWTYYWWQWTPGGLFSSSSTNLRDKPGAMLFWWMLPFLVIALIHASRRRSRVDLLLLGWAAIGPLPAALTYDGTVPNFLRGTWTMPALVMLTAVGVYTTIRAVDRFERARLLRAALIVAILIPASVQGVVYYRDYFDARHGYPARSASWWYYGTGAALRSVRRGVPAGTTVCIGGVSYWTFPQYTTYYFGAHPRFTVIEGVDDARCKQDGTYVLAPVRDMIATPTHPIVTTNDYTGNPLYRLSVVGATSHRAMSGRI
jgi:4-amino-4-deoxy-L-arabinose transferase-like glycosyltransferase